MGLKELIEDETKKRERFMALGYANVFGLSADERLKLDVAYRTAEVEWRIASGKVLAVMDALVTPF